MYRTHLESRDFIENNPPLSCRLSPELAVGTLLSSCLLLLINFATYLLNFCPTFGGWEFWSWDLCLSSLPLLPALQRQAVMVPETSLNDNTAGPYPIFPTQHSSKNVGQVPGSPQQTHHSVLFNPFFFSLLLYLYPVTCRSFVWPLFMKYPVFGFGCSVCAINIVLHLWHCPTSLFSCS